MDNFEDNLGPHYATGEDLFVSLALFFPCFTGILAGANRMEALAKPFEAVPNGTSCSRRSCVSENTDNNNNNRYGRCCLHISFLLFSTSDLVGYSRTLVVPQRYGVR